MGPHGSPWVPMGRHGSPWMPMGPQGSPWVPMSPHGSPMGRHGSPWVPRSALVPMGPPWDLHGFLRHPIVPQSPYGPQKHAMAAPQRLWFLVDSNATHKLHLSPKCQHVRDATYDASDNEVFTSRAVCQTCRLKTAWW